MDGDGTDSMKAYMERLASQHRAGSYLSWLLAGGYGTAAGAGVLSTHPAGVAAAIPLGAMSYKMGSLGSEEWSNAKRADAGAKMWGSTGLPERPLPETPEGDAARRSLIEALLSRAK